MMTVMIIARDARSLAREEGDDDDHLRWVPAGMAFRDQRLISVVCLYPSATRYTGYHRYRYIIVISSKFTTTTTSAPLPPLTPEPPGYQLAFVNNSVRTPLIIRLTPDGSSVGISFPRAFDRPHGIFSVGNENKKGPIFSHKS